MDPCTDSDGHLQAVTELNTLYDVMDKDGRPRVIDNELMPFLKAENAQTEVLPLVNNFDPIANQWKEDIGPFLNNADSRGRFRQEIAKFWPAINTVESRSTLKHFRFRPSQAIGA
jgi:hypothetical protein